MNLLLTDEQRAYAEGLRRYLDGLDLTEVYAERRVGTAEVSEAGPVAQRLLRKMSKDGWLGVGWPTEYGGGGRTAVEQWIFIEEMTYRNLPTGGLTLSAIGPTIMRVGSEAQKATFLPGILSGDLVFAIGYSEPNAGTDLASLQTRAIRAGDDYLINGQKIYTTGAHYATHIWLAARTGERDSRSRGISVIIVPIDTPGIVVRPLFTQSDGRTNEVFFSDVTVPIENRVGAENGGWDIIRLMLSFERLMPYSSLWQHFERLLAWADTPEAGGTVPIHSVEVRGKLGRLAAEIEIARLLALRTAALIDEGDLPPGTSSITKVFYSELQQRLHVAAMELAGPSSRIRVGDAKAPAEGAFERLYRSSSMLKFGAGANEIQREIIATQRLGLPRSQIKVRT